MLEPEGRGGCDENDEDNGDGEETGRTIMLLMVMGIMTRTGMAVTSRRRRVGCVSGSPWKECGSDARYLPESQHLLPPSSKLLLGRVTVP